MPHDMQPCLCRTSGVVDDQFRSVDYFDGNAERAMREAAAGLRALAAEVAGRWVAGR